MISAKVHVVGVDPGKATGVALWPEGYTNTVGPESMVADLCKCDPMPKVVVCENFQLRQITALQDARIPLLLIGQLMEASRREGFELVLAEPFVIREMKRDHASWSEGWRRFETPHARDAAAHVVRWLKHNPDVC